MRSRNARAVSIAALTAGVIVAGLGTSTAQAAEPSTPNAASAGTAPALSGPAVSQGAVDNLLTAVGGLLGGLLQTPPPAPGTQAPGAGRPLHATITVTTDPSAPVAVNAPAQLPPLPPLPAPLPQTPALPSTPGLPQLPGDAPATPGVAAPALPSLPPLPAPTPALPPLPGAAALPVPLPQGEPATTGH
jgi:hypothetical protein